MIRPRQIRITPEVASMIIARCPDLSHFDALADLRAIAAEPEVKGKGRSAIVYVDSPPGRNIL